MAKIPSDFEAAPRFRRSSLLRDRSTILAGQYLRGSTDLITIYERDSTDLRARVTQKANRRPRRRLFTRSTRRFFL